MGSTNGGEELRYDIGDKVVYPNHGVGIIEEIKTREIAGEEQDFYHLRIFSNETTVMVPVGNSRTVGLRKLFDEKEVQELFAHLEDGEVDTYSNWKGRYKGNAEKMRSGHLMDMADVLKNLVVLSQRKTLSYREKQMYEKAKYLIVSEIAIIEGETEATVEERIDEALEKTIAKKEKAKAKKKEKKSA